jgi:hypothetical protein
MSQIERLKQIEEDAVVSGIHRRWKLAYAKLRETKPVIESAQLAFEIAIGASSKEAEIIVQAILEEEQIRKEFPCLAGS